MSPKHIEECYDAVIVGAGAAGLSAALGLYRSDAMQALRAQGSEPKILVVSKLQSLRSHTGSAEGGIAASLGNVEPDNWHWHYFDTVKGGDWLVDQDAARVLAQEAPQTVINLERSGVAFSRTKDGLIAQRRFGGHTKEFGQEPVKRAAYSADRIGHQILHTLWQQCVAYGVQFAEEWYVSDLVLDEPRSRVAGIVAYDTHAGTTHAIAATHVIMATGGAGRLFHTTSNSHDLTGDGMALALQAGLQLEDIEFMQFHPTGLAHTGILLSEASRAEGGVLRNAHGEAFMARYAPEHKDLAARDVVSRAMRAEIEAGRGVADPKDPLGPKDCLWLDLTGLDAQHMRAVLPQVVQTVEDYAGLDPSREYIPVKPTAHYTMGGIPTTLNGQVYTWSDGERHIVEGLYAAGECACVSVHGANRLGGNSLLDACLFGTRAGAMVALRLLDQPAAASDVDPALTEALEAAQAHRDEQITAMLATTPPDDVEASEQPTDNAYQLMADLGSVMEAGVAVTCDGASITRALHSLEADLEPRARALRTHSDARTFNQEITAIWEARHLIELARTMLTATDARHESRGSLYRTDFPQRDDTGFLTHSMTAAGQTPLWQPVHIVNIEPGTRAY